MPFSRVYLLEFILHPYLDCKCDLEGSTGINCDYDGKCNCANGNVIGDKCDSCADGLYGFPQCTQGRQLCKIFYIEKKFPESRDRWFF